MSKIKIDHDNYRALSKPFGSNEEAETALNKFFDAVYKARQEFKLPDVHVIVKINIKADGQEGSAISGAHFGDSNNAESMCAWAYGNEAANRESVIQRMLRGEGHKK